MNVISFSIPDLIVISITTFLIAFTYTTIQKANDDSSRRKFLKGFLIYLSGIICFIILSLTGFFSETTVPPRFPLFFIFNFSFMFVLIFQKKESLSPILSIPAYLLVYVQSFRVILEVAVFLFHKNGITPRELTFMGQSFDSLVAISAIPAGYYLSKGYRKIGILFNIFGLLSLANIIFLAVFSFPTAFRIYSTNTLPTYFPGILVPLYIAPTALFIHVISLMQLLNFKVLRVRKLA